MKKVLSVALMVLLLAGLCLPAAEPCRAVLGGGSGWMGEGVSHGELRSGALAPSPELPTGPVPP